MDQLLFRQETKHTFSTVIYEGKIGEKSKLEE